MTNSYPHLASEMRNAVSFKHTHTHALLAVAESHVDDTPENGDSLLTVAFSR